MFLPRPVADCRYYHRSLNIRKLVEVGFSRLPARQTLPIAERLFHLPSEHILSGIRPMEKKDVPTVRDLLQGYFQRCETKLYPILNENEVEHWLLPRPGVVDCFVREAEGQVTDFFSFYHLPSSVIKINQKHKILQVRTWYAAVLPTCFCRRLTSTTRWLPLSPIKH